MEGNLHLIFFLLLRLLSNFQVDFAFDLGRLMCTHCHTNTSFRKLMWRHFTSLSRFHDVAFVLEGAEVILDFDNTVKHN